MNSFRFALRALSKNPAFAIVAIAILVGGISGAASMFSFVNSFVLNAVPFADPDSLLYIRVTRQDGAGRALTPVEVTESRAAVLPESSGFLVTTHAVEKAGQAERITAGHVEPPFFQVLRTVPALGRTFRADDEYRRVAVLSHELWERRFQSRAAAIGEFLDLDGERYEVIGVLPRSFQFTLTGKMDVWRPMMLSAEARASRTNRFLRVVARLPKGKTLTAINGDLERISRQLDVKKNEFTLTAELFQTEIGRHTGRPIIFSIFGVTVGLLLIACSNVANLLLARAFDRQRQTAIQLALGATPGTITRQLLAETLTVFLIAGVLAVAAADRMCKLLTSWIPEDSRQYLPNGAVVETDPAVLLFGVGIAAVTGLLFGLGPALEAARVNVSPVLKESGSAVGQSRRHGGWQRILVAVQLLLATALLISVGVMVRNFRNIWDVPIGFEPANLTTFQIMMDEKRYATPESRLQYVRQVMAVLPPELSPSAADFVPFSQDGGGTSYSVDGRERRTAWYNRITPGYFQSLGAPILAGRAFSAEDRYNGKRVAIVNEGFAAREFPGKNPLGQVVRLHRGPTAVEVEIAGICGNILHNYGDTRTAAAIYVPFEQEPDSDAMFVLRGANPPMNAIRSRVAALDPLQPVWQIRSMEDLMRNQSAAYELSGQILAYFGLLALVIAVVGLYSVIAFNALRRNREFGIRGALGATPGDIARLVSGNAARMALAGLAPGVLLAYGAVRVIASVIPDFGEPEYWIFPAVIAALVVAIAPAALLPAWRSAKLDPLKALRHE